MNGARETPEIGAFRRLDVPRTTGGSVLPRTGEKGPWWHRDRGPGGEVGS